MNFANRSYEKELLDRVDIPFDAIERNMHELEIINGSLGGHAITIAGLQQLVKNKSSITICEIGCGGGDNLKAIEKMVPQKRHPGQDDRHRYQSLLHYYCFFQIK